MILVCGEALIDLLLGEAAEGASLPAAAVAGGSPFNLAVGLARLGVPAGYLGGLSEDRLGRFLETCLRDEGVATGLVRHSTRPTPLVVIATDAQGQPAYTFHAQDCAERDLRPEHLPAALGPEVEAIAMGSYTLAIEPVGTALLELAAREGGRRVLSLDPNLRPSLVGDLDAWRERFERFARQASIIKLSIEDLHAAYGAGAAPGEWAAHWLGEGAALVVVTLGAEGALAWHAGAMLRQAGIPVHVADTVGAGDTFHAALLARLRARGLLTRQALAGMESAALGDALGHAALAASITCTRRGADLPRAAEIEAAMRGQTVR